MKRPAGSRKAYTLVELSMASAIILAVLTAAVCLYIFYWRTLSIGNTILDVYSNSRLAMGYMSRDIRWSSQVVAQYPESGSPAYSTNDNVIVLKVPAIDAAGAIITTSYDYIIFKLQGSDLYRIVCKDALSSRQNENYVIARHCASLSFSSGGVALSHIGNLSTINTVAIYLPLNKSTLSLGGTGTEIVSMTPTTSVRMRNK